MIAYIILAEVIMRTHILKLIYERDVTVVLVGTFSSVLVDTLFSFHDRHCSQSVRLLVCLITRGPRDFVVSTLTSYWYLILDLLNSSQMTHISIYKLYGSDLLGSL